jgi:hypothetical protein
MTQGTGGVPSGSGGMTGSMTSMMSTGSGGMSMTATGTGGMAPSSGTGGSSAVDAGTGGKASTDAGDIMDAGTDGATPDGGDDGMMDCGSDGTTGQASNAGGGSGRGNGSVQFTISAGNQILRMVTTLETPVKPSGNSTLFLWPGLEPLQGENYSPIGTGVLQPVLTWGGSCAPGYSAGMQSDTWWISSQYVNTLGNAPGYMGCYGGDIMNVGIGDKLLIDMSLNGTVWTQTVTDQANQKKVDFDMDMMDQPQRWALFEIEMPTSTKPAADVVFTDTLIVLEKPEPEACQPTARGSNDYYSAPVASKDGLRCCVSRLVLRAQGVPATTMDP